MKLEDTPAERVAVRLGTAMAEAAAVLDDDGYEMMQRALIEELREKPENWDIRPVDGVWTMSLCGMIAAAEFIEEATKYE
jgi:hypothetical protein